MDVKRIVGFVLLGSALGIVFFVFYFLLNTSEEDPGDVPSWWRGTSYSGKVVTISPEIIKIDVRDDAHREFRIDGNTRFFLWGNEPVRPGMEVKVLYKLIRDKDKSYMVARSVRVLKPSETPSPSPDATSSPSPAATTRPSPTASPKATTSPR